jgi:hypothetical protein
MLNLTIPHCAIIKFSDLQNPIECRQVPWQDNQSKRYNTHTVPERSLPFFINIKNSTSYHSFISSAFSHLHFKSLKHQCLNKHITNLNTTIFIRQLGVYVQLSNTFKLITSSSDSQITLKKHNEEDNVRLITSHS